MPNSSWLYISCSPNRIVYCFKFQLHCLQWYRISFCYLSGWSNSTGLRKKQPGPVILYGVVFLNELETHLNELETLLLYTRQVNWLFQCLCIKLMKSSTGGEKKAGLGNRKKRGSSSSVLPLAQMPSPFRLQKKGGVDIMTCKVS